MQKEFPLYPSNGNLNNNQSLEQDNTLLGYSRIALAKQTEENLETAKIFSTATFFNDLKLDRRIVYKSAVYVIKTEKMGNKLQLLYENQDHLQELSCEYDSVFLGAGCINTTGIVDRSLYGVGTREYYLKSPVGYINAFIRIGFTLEKEIRIRRDANLPEFFMETNSKATNYTWSHTQITAINEQIIKAISNKLPFFKGALAQLFRNTFYFAISVVHSKIGKSTLIKMNTDESSDGSLRYSMIIQEQEQSMDNTQYQSSILKSVLKNWNRLKMLPIPLGNKIADFFRGNKLGGWHYGGTIPMSLSPKEGQSYPNGEVYGLKNVYLIDSSSFPEIPGSTVALLIAANSYRVSMQWIKNNLSKDI
ncbi:MAG: hypothetical protein IPG24_22405 [Leptospiraceae bacterium]|nr:hypothetical protein [Leptospiraceae bacterium]